MSEHNLTIESFSDQERAQAIHDLYQTIFRRVPDDHGWQSHYNSKRSIKDLEKSFKESHEYRLKSRYWKDGHSLDEIIPGELFVGTRIQEGSEDEVKARYRVKAIVCVDHTSKYDLRKFDAVLYVPFPDSELMPISQAVIAVNGIRQFVEQGMRTLIHCRWGASRSPAIAAFYMAKRYGLSFQEAHQRIEEKRDGVRVSDGLLTPQRIDEIMKVLSW